MKYAIIENDIVKQIQCDDKYDLSETETIMEVDDSVKVGMQFMGMNEFSIPEKVLTIEEQINIIDKETEKKIFDKYSDNAQRTLSMKAIMGDKVEFEVMTLFVNTTLAEGQAKKDALTK